jgi:hypothetical protein
LQGQPKPRAGPRAAKLGRENFRRFRLVLFVLNNQIGGKFEKIIKFLSCRRMEKQSLVDIFGSVSIHATERPRPLLRGREGKS